MNVWMLVSVSVCEEKHLPALLNNFLKIMKKAMDVSSVCILLGNFYLFNFLGVLKDCSSSQHVPRDVNSELSNSGAGKAYAFFVVPLVSLFCLFSFSRVISGTSMTLICESLSTIFKTLHY